MRVNDALTGAVLVLFALAMLAYTVTFPGLPGQDYGPALFPRLIGIGMILTGAILIAGGLRRRGTEPLVDGTGWLRQRPALLRFGAVIGGLVVYVLVSDILGFIPTALGLLFGWLVLFRGGKPVSSLVIALLTVLVVDYAFTRFLLVPLPLGVLQAVIY